MKLQCPSETDSAITCESYTLNPKPKPETRNPKPQTQPYQELAGELVEKMGVGDLYGLNPQLSWPIRDCWALGFSVSWFRDFSGFRV